jgi:hypothetical protein
MSPMLAASAVAGLLMSMLMVAPPASGAAAPQLKRYPYLSDTVGASATVNWATDRSATTGSVRWGTVDGSGACAPATEVAATRTSITVNGVSQYQWKASLSLAAATEFCYRVYLGTTDLLASDPTPRAKPVPPAGSVGPYSFVVLGDTGQVDGAGNNTHQANVMRRIADSGARFAVQTGDFGHPNNDQKNFGDLIQKGTNTSAIFGPAFWKDAGTKIPVFAAPGNHGVTNNAVLTNFPQDRAVSQSGGKYEMVTYCCLNNTNSQSQQTVWYAFDVGNARYYVLTSAWSNNNLGSAPGERTSHKLYKNDYDNHWTPSSAQYQWLQADLAAHADTPVKFAFFHFPLYSDQKANPDNTYLQGASSVEGLLARNGVDVAFNGHAHIYQRNRPSSQGLRTYVTGGGGATLASIGESGCSPIDAYGIGWSNSQGRGNACGSAPTPSSMAEVYHFLLVTVDGTNVTVTPTNSLGQTFDVQTYDLSGSAPPTDTTAPAAPGNLSASATSATSVDLSWDAATDDVGVTGYDVYRDGSLLQAGVTTTSYTDTTAAAETTYAYTVRAKDAAGNVSADSNTATVTTPAGGGGSGTLTFEPVADARVEQDQPAANFGTLTRLAADQSPTAQVESYLKFDVSGVSGSVASAKLRVWTSTGTTSATGNGPGVFGVSDSTWTEGGITWANRPPHAATAVDNKGALTADMMVEYDVTSLITGNGTYSLNLTPDSTDGTLFDSREVSNPARRPQLVLTTG